MKYEDLPNYAWAARKKEYTGWARSTIGGQDRVYIYYMMEGAWQFTVIKEGDQYAFYFDDQEDAEPIENVDNLEDALQVAHTLWRMSQ